MLKELLTNEPALPLSIDASAREVITEVGNILLNACLGTFGNLLQGAGLVLGAAPEPRERRRDPASRCWSTSEGLRYALVVHAGFRLRDAEVTRLPGDRAERRVARPPDSRGRRVGAARRGDDDAGRRHRSAGDRRAAGGSRSWPTAGIFTTDER